MDQRKLKAFTEHTEDNRYHYKNGVFILIGTREYYRDEPKVVWFKNGTQE